MDAQGLTSSQRKLVMWYKVTELKSKGLHCVQIARELGLHRHTVEKYVKMTLEEFQTSQAYERGFKYKLDIFEEEVKNELMRAPYLSSRQVHDHLREHHADFPEVSEKTVFNFVMRVRDKYRIPKMNEETFRPMEKLPESAPGKSMQVDFGEYWMHRDDTRRVKVYFFVAVMSYSCHKFTYFSKTPFTSELAIYAHQLAFQFYGGKPQEVIYDQDKVFIHSENFGDLVLTKAFQAFVSSEHFKCVFCRKSDPQSKGKVENVVKYIKYGFLRGRDFTNIEMLNESALRWLARTANGLPHSTTKRPGQAILDETIQRPKLPNRKELENYILAYLEGNAIVAMWLKNLYETKPRYYRANINKINTELESFLPEHLIKGFEVCLDKGDYNANDLINYCERHFGRIPKGPREPSLAELLPESLQQLPQRSNINDYKSIFV